MVRPKKEDYIEFEDDNQYERYMDYIRDLEKYCDELEHGSYKEFKGKKLVTEKESKNALFDLGNLVEFRSMDEVESGQIFEDSYATLQQSIEEHFNNSVDFKHFKIYSNGYLYQKFKKGELIDYIHMLYYNWQSCDNWCGNLLEANKKLYEDKSKLLDDVHDYRYENHCMKLTIRNLCEHFGVETITELEQIYLKEK